MSDLPTTIDVVERLRSRATAQREYREAWRKATPAERARFFAVSGRPGMYGASRLDDEAADEIESLRAQLPGAHLQIAVVHSRVSSWIGLAMEWRKIAAVLICPHDDDTERLAWASGVGWDDLTERTDAALSQPAGAGQ